MEQYFNFIIMAADGSNNIKFWNGTDLDVDDLADHPSYGGSDPNPPNASIVRSHLGRLWTNDRDNPDRIHFSETNNPLKWIGAGDSGALDIGIGDGDPEGITAIFPSFKGSLFVAKRNRLYRITGFTPLTFQVTLISNSIGCTSHNAVAIIDQDDIYWLSDRGVHSLAATEKFGDFEGGFVSKKIQRTFNETFNRSQFQKAFMSYLPELNSLALTISEGTESSHNDLYLYNKEQQAWYRWPDISCTSLATVTDSDQRRFYLGTSTTRISRTFNGVVDDTRGTGVSSNVKMTAASGVLYVDGSPYTTKAFKKISLLYEPIGTYKLDAKIKIDNLPEQTVSFSDAGFSPLLGSTFILGETILGVVRAITSYVASIDGYGRGIKVTLQEFTSLAEANVQGFMIEFEPAGDSQEVVIPT